LAKKKTTSFFLPAFSQETSPVTILGLVKDSSGNALSSITVTEKGTNNATVTNTEGKFTIKVAGQKSVLVISSVGYATQQIRVDNRTDIIVSMVVAKSDLDEVVVVGYGTKRKESLTGAICNG
jgi:hypothetical protein